MDGVEWKRFEGGEEIDLGVLPMKDGVLDFWLDACFRDPVSPGPAYFDYVRLMPVADTPRAAALAAAAMKKPPHVEASRVDERRVAISLPAAPVNWPVRASVPLRRGELLDPRQSAVLDIAGKPLPTQARALATWPDGSVKWLHVDFAATGANQYYVTYGSAVQARPGPARVRLEESTTGMAVDTGAVRFQIPRSRFGVIEQGGRPLAIEITEVGGRIWRAQDLPVAKMEIEQGGPYHVAIRVETARAESGKPASGFFHRARIHAYAGSPLVHVDYFVANTDARPRVGTKSIAIRVPAAGVLPKAAAHVATAQTAEVTGVETSARLSVGVADFREQYPKALRSRAGEIEAALWAPEGGGFEWFQGVGKTHRLSLWYGAPPREAALLGQGPLIAFPKHPASMAPTGAFGEIGTAAESPLTDVEQTLARHMADPVVAKIGYGFENYGDHSSSGYVQGTYLWDNNEYDLPAAAMVHFARTGDTAALKAGLAAALHYADVDTIHYHAARADYLGGAWTHSHGTSGHHTAEPPGMSHAGYTQGLIWYTYLTGHPEGLEAARGIADWCLRNIRPERNVNAMERALGHPLMTLTDIYEATWDDQYIRGAAKLVDWALQWENPERGGHMNSITEKPAYYSGSPFCSGLLAAGLMKFNGWARNGEVTAMLERMARWVLTDMWRPNGIFNKGGGSPYAGNISTHLPLMRAMYEKTRDPLFIALPYALTVAGYGEGARGFGTRSTGLVFNYLPPFAAMLNEFGHPEPDTAFTISADDVTVNRGRRFLVTYAIRNGGRDEIKEIDVSFQPRLDFRVNRTEPGPRTLAPGQMKQMTFELEAPTDINLTHALNRDAYAHLVVRFKRAGRVRFAHGFAKVELVP
jgi:hypothetical protein